MTRAYSGLLPQNQERDSDFSKIEKLIEMIPSNGEQAILWSDLALTHLKNGKSHKCKMITSEKIKYRLSNITNYDQRYRFYVITKIAPALYLSHKTTALELINELSEVERDIALNNVTNFICTKTLPSDPYDSVLEQGYELTHEELVDLCEIIDLIQNDSLIFNIICDIVETLLSKKNRNKFTHQQREDISSRLNKLIIEKLPSKNYITHLGYKIVSKAQLLRLYKNRVNSDWLQLIDETETIENISDRVFVYITIASILPSSLSTKEDSLIEKIESLINTFPSTYEKIKRYELLGHSFVKQNQIICKKYLTRAMEISVDNSDDKDFSTQKRLVDLAYRIDPEFAESLVSITDDDPARKKIRKELKDEIRTIELKRNHLSSSKEINTENKLKRNETYINASWRLLGSINSNRLKTVPYNETLTHIGNASQLPIGLSFPIYSWVIENSNIRYKVKAADSKEYIRPILEASMSAAELSLLMSGSNKTYINQISQIKRGSKNSMIVRPGDRLKAYDYIKEWLNIVPKNSTIKICDPFFGTNELELIEILRSVRGDIDFEVLTGLKHQKQEDMRSDLEEEYLKHWRLNVSDQKPPEVRIVVAGVKSSGELPIHDRWIISEDSGLRLGTSLNNLGLSKESEISYLKVDEVDGILQEVNKYLNSQERSFNGERISYQVFYLV